MSRNVITRETRLAGYGDCVFVALDGEEIGYIEVAGKHAISPGLVRIVVDDVETTIDDLRDMIAALTKLAAIATEWGAT